MYTLNHRFFFQGLKSINTDIKTLAEKARENKLQPHEFQVSCFPSLSFPFHSLPFPTLLLL